MTDDPSLVEEVAQQPSRNHDIAPVRRFWESLGLPGPFDVHVHFLPPNIQRAVYEVFDSAGPKIGREWPIRYRQNVEERVELLRAMGVRRFPTIPYPYLHRLEGLAHLGLGDSWVRDVCWTNAGRIFGPKKSL